MHRLPWKSGKNVKSIRFSKNKKGRKIRIGGASFGNIFVGSLHFKDGTRKRVAVKVFDDPLRIKKVNRLKAVIRDLHNAGVRIPKMWPLKVKTERHPKGEWVLVSQLFGSVKKGSKIVNKSLLKDLSETQQVEAVRELTKVANAGYFPGQDISEPFKSKGKGIIPIDLDVLLARGSVKISAGLRAKILVGVIEKLSSYAKVRSKLFGAAMEAASEEMKAALKRQVKDKAWGKR